MDDGRVLAGVAVATLVAAGLVRGAGREVAGSTVRPGPRLRVAGPAEPMRSLLSLYSIDVPSLVPGQPGREVKLDQVLTAFRDRNGDEHALFIANWPTLTREKRGRGHATRYPWLHFDVQPKRIEILRRNKGWKDILFDPGGWKEGSNDWVELDASTSVWAGGDTWWFEAAITAARHVLAAERSGPDVRWSALRGSSEGSPNRGSLVRPGRRLGTAARVDPKLTYYVRSDSRAFLHPSASIAREDPS